MKITIEMVDQVMERVPYITYEEAKKALEISDGDVLDAIIYIEKEEEKAFNGNYDDETEKKEFSKEAEQIKKQITDLIKKSSVVRIIVDKEDKIVFNIPLTIGVVGFALMPFLSLIGLSAAVLSEHSLKIKDENSDEVVDLGKLNKEKLEILKEMFIDRFQDFKETVKKTDKDVKEETSFEDTKKEEDKDGKTFTNKDDGETDKK